MLVEDVSLIVEEVMTQCDFLEDFASGAQLRQYCSGHGLHRQLIQINQAIEMTNLKVLLFGVELGTIALDNLTRDLEMRLKHSARIPCVYCIQLAISARRKKEEQERETLPTSEPMT